MNDCQPAASSLSELEATLSGVSRELLELERELRALEAEMREAIDAVPPAGRESARNLVHYVALRQRDLRDLQGRLSHNGLSSLGRTESCVMGGLLEVSMRAHESLALHDPAAKAELDRLAEARRSALAWDTAIDQLHQNTVDSFGPRPADRHIYVMVTAPSADEADSDWMARLLDAGMNVLRINCAHDDEAAWGRMLDGLEQARQRTGKACRVIMDLAGPKIRTGRVQSKRRIATWKPVKDDIGRPVAPARVVIRRASALASDAQPATLLIADVDFQRLRVHDELCFRDTRDKRRTLLIEAVGVDRLLATSSERAYVLGKVEAQVRRGKKHKDDVLLEVEEGVDDAIDVKPGDPLVLTRRAVVGAAPERDRKGHVETPGIISCTLPAALEHLEVGQRVLFDDGRIQTVVERLKASGDFLLRVSRTHKQTSKLRAEKGINLPDTRITVPGLTDQDRSALEFVVKRADGVSLSFVRSVEDVRSLHAELDRLGRKDIAVVLKIETRAGFQSLPALLLEGLRKPPLNVMIARGDLAVEVGFERLAELQEEMLWLCEAAHVPAVWATQVLDTLARTGVPSRAEVTDAAASVAAECVMLNKGAYIQDAVSMLSSILRRMEQHRYKKRSLFRRLEVSSFAQK